MFGSSTAARQTGRLAPYVLSAIFVLLHLIFGTHISVFGAKPGFLLVLAACFAFLFGSRAGCIAGFGFGLLFDLTGTGTVGLSPLFCCVAGYALGYRQRNAFADGWKAPLVEFSLAALAYNALYYAALLMFSTGVTLDGVALARIVVSTIIDAALAAVTFWLLARHDDGLVGKSGLRL